MMSKRRTRLWIILVVTATLAVLAGMLLLRPDIAPIFAQEGGESETGIKEYQEAEKERGLDDLTVMPASIANPEPDTESNVDAPFSVEERDGPLEQVGPVEGTIWGDDATAGEEMDPAGGRPPVTQ